MARRNQMVAELEQLKASRIAEQRQRDEIDRQLVLQQQLPLRTSRSSSSFDSASTITIPFSSDSEATSTKYHERKRSQISPKVKNPGKAKHHAGNWSSDDAQVRSKEKLETAQRSPRRNAPFVEEINMLRQNYLRNGGSSQVILLKLAELEAQALANGKSHDNLISQLVARKSHETEDDDKENSYRNRLRDLQLEMELTKREADVGRLRKQLELKVDPKQTPSLSQPLPDQVSSQTVCPAADVPLLLQNSISYDHTDMNQPTVGETKVQSVVSLDFVTGLDASVQWLRLVVGFVAKDVMCTEPVVLPAVMCVESGNQMYYNSGRKVAFVQTAQTCPRCASSSILSAVVELQCSTTAYQGASRLTSQAWCLIPLFNDGAHLLHGRWRVPLRLLPIQFGLSVSQINLFPQFGTVECFIRVANALEVNDEWRKLGGLDYIAQYRHLAQPIMSSTRPHIPPLPVEMPIDMKTPQDSFRTRQQDFEFFGVQVDRVKNAESGILKVRLTGISGSSGKTLQCSKGPVTCCTTAVADNFRYYQHVFGWQEASFPGLAPGTAGAMLVARLILRDDGYHDNDWQEAGKTDERLIAWTVLPLTKRDGSLRYGKHTLRLYEPPIPGRLHTVIKDTSWQPYRKDATLGLYVFHDAPLSSIYGSITESEEQTAAEDDKHEIPPQFWLPLRRLKPPTTLFLAGDGIDLYIDGCRNLPDGATITRVSARVMDRDYVKIGPDMNTSVKLDSDIYNPIYEHRTELRERAMPATATLFMKVYTIDAHQQLAVAGYCTFNLFVDSGTERQPSTNRTDQVCLNEGAHQLRLYRYGPNSNEPLSKTCLYDNRIPAVPCATILVRIFKAPVAAHGGPMTAERVPRCNWEEVGLWHPRPHYSDHVYYSTGCRPTRSECLLFAGLQQREPLSVREAVQRDVSVEDAGNGDHNMDTYIRTRLTKLMDVVPVSLDWAFITQYSPQHGIKCTIRSAHNLPWTNFTQGQMCLNPPGAFYMGVQQASYDVLTFVHYLDLRSTNRCPVFKEPLKAFPSRLYHKHLAVIIHLQNVIISVTDDGYEYNLTEQAWTTLDLMKDGYAQTGVFQLPIFYGAPTKEILHQLASEPLLDCLDRHLQEENLVLIDDASVTVAVCDARRDAEVDENAHAKILVNRDYLPEDRLEGYDRELEGEVLLDMVPEGKTPSAFLKSLATKYESLVYKTST